MAGVVEVQASSVPVSVEADNLDLACEEPAETYISEAFTKKALFQKWTSASLRANNLKSDLDSVKKELKDLQKDKKLLEREVGVFKCGKTRADKLQYELSIVNVEKMHLKRKSHF